MSYILDALKKSEQERKRGNIPDLQSVQVAVRPFRRSSLGMIILLSVWAVITLVLIGLWLQQKYRVTVITETVPQSASVQSSTAITASAVPSAEPVVQIAATTNPAAALAAMENELIDDNSIENKQPLASEELTEPVTAAPRARTTSGLDETAEAEIIRPRQARAAASAPKAKLARQTEPLEEANERIETEDDFQYLPQLSQLPAAFTQTLPPLDFISHLYSSDPASRSVIINGSNWHEHDHLQPDLQLIAIIPEGVVLSYQGKQFRMAVVQDWSGGQ